MLVELNPEKNHSKTMVVCVATAVMQQLPVIAVLEQRQ